MASDLAAQAAKRLPLVITALLPQRQRGPARRDGSQLDSMLQQAGDCYYRCAVEVAKVIYTRIDARYPYPRNEEAVRLKHADKMNEARKILNESRNDVFEAVLPMFTVKSRVNGAPMTDADIHVHDYIVRNIFDMMTRTQKAYADQYVEHDEVEVLERNIDKVAAIQRERLAGMLLNFEFGFRPLAMPK